MNKQSLSFTYNFDISHLNKSFNPPNTPNENLNNQDDGNNGRTPNQNFHLPPINNLLNNTPSSPSPNIYRDQLNQMNQVQIYSPQTQQVQSIQSPFPQYYNQQGFPNNGNSSITSNNNNINNLLNAPNYPSSPNNNPLSYGNINSNNNNNLNTPYNNNYNGFNSSMNNNLLSNSSSSTHSLPRAPLTATISNNDPLPQRQRNRPTPNPLLSAPQTPKTPNPLLSSSTLFSNPLNGLGMGMGAENLELEGEETEELNKMNINQYKDLIPAESDTKDTSEEEVHYNHKEPVMQNVISTFFLDCKLDLQKIQKKARNTEYHPKRFAALIMRIRSPQTTALIFASGKVVVTGAKNESESKLACKKFARIVKKLDFPATFKDFKVQNIVASCEVGYKVSLESLVTSEHGNSCRFEPELFPGLIYKMIEPKVTLLIFVSGKIVITGAKSKEGVEQSFKNISPVLINFKK